MLPITFRTQTFAVGDRTFSDELRSIVVPVRDERAAIIAAMLIVLPAERLTESSLSETLLPALMSAARQAAQRSDEPAIGSRSTVAV